MSKRWKTFFMMVIIVSCIEQGACEKISYEGYKVVEDRTRIKNSESILEDNTGAGGAIWPGVSIYKKGEQEIREGKNYDHVIYQGPYAIYVSISAVEHPVRGHLENIEIQEAYFDIVYKDDKVVRIDLGKKSTDWVKDIQKQTKFIKSSVSFGAGSKVGFVEIDFLRLKEVHFYIKYTGIYENGDHREYWQERYFIPSHTIERRSGLENMLMQ